MKKNILAVLLGSVVLFAWGYFSWTVMPWDTVAFHSFTDEAAVSTVLTENAPQKGVYALPHKESDYAPGKPFAFVSLLPEGFSDGMMTKLMVSGFLITIFSVFLVVLLFRQTSQQSYTNKVLFIALLGFAIGFISHAPYWNWLGFSTPYTLMVIVDSLIGWSLAGLVIAKLAEQQKAS